MANRFVRDMLRAQYDRLDGRNPYGSRGGYVTSRSPRRDRGQGMPYNGYPPHDMRNMPPYPMQNDMRNMPPMSYDMNGVPYDGNMGYGYDGNYDMRGRDYGEQQYGKLSREDLEEWKRNLKNKDGSHGEHFSKEQVEQIARQMGIDVNRYGGLEVFAMAMNMKYSDDCRRAKKYGVDRPEYYADGAIDFLTDDDANSQGEERLWLYYKCMVEK